MKLKVSTNSKVRLSTLIIFLAIAVWNCIFLPLRNAMPEAAFVSACILSALALFLLEVRQIIVRSGLLLSPAVLFLCSFYLFQNGQFFLLAIQADFNTFYIDTLRYLLKDAVLYSSQCTLAAGFAGMLMAHKKPSANAAVSAVDRYCRKDVSRAALWGIGLTAVITIPLILAKFAVFSLAGGYGAVRDFENRIPSPVKLAEYMFIPFVILYLVYTRSRHIRLVVLFAAAVWSVLTALCGDRTSGISGLMALFLVQYLEAEDRRKLKRNTVRLILGGLACLVLIRIAVLFRHSGSVQDVLEGMGQDGSNLLVDVISELGFNAFSVMSMMHVVPEYEPFQMGYQYLMSALAGIFPSSLDFTGIVHVLTASWNIFDQWLLKYFSQYSFGLGFSMNAEAYINFGWFGSLAIFPLCLVIFSNLPAYFGQMKDGQRYQVYKTITLLFIWFTLPRRSSYYIWNALFWCVLIVKFYLRLVCRRNAGS